MMYHALGDDAPPHPWQHPWEYDAWKAMVLKGEACDEELLKALYKEQWEPTKLYKALLQRGRFARQSKALQTRRVILDLDTVKKRIAKAIWVECGRLLTRRMTPEARHFVSETQATAQDAAEIIVY